MHPHLIDWLRHVEITTDATLAQKRWAAAESYAKTLDRLQSIELLRLFLFPRPDPAAVKKFSDALVVLDPEFPPTNNALLVRLMAGVVMVTAFEASSYNADAFALGLRAARMGGRRGQPVQPAIAALANEYLQKEARSLRARDFSYDTEALATKLVKKHEAMHQAASEDEAARKKAVHAYQQAIANEFGGGTIDQRLRQLSEETQLLWWVIGAYSPALGRRTVELTPVAYALVAAAEAAERVYFSPAPLAVEELLARALDGCAASKRKKEPALSDYLQAADASWRAKQVKDHPEADCPDLVPVSTGLAKLQESDDVAAAGKTLEKLCPGLKPSDTLAPVLAARQYFTELMFLKAVTEV